MKKVVRNGERRARLINKKSNDAKFLKFNLKQVKVKPAKTLKNQVENKDKIIKLKECEIISDEPREQMKAEEHCEYLELPLKTSHVTRA